MQDVLTFCIYLLPVICDFLMTEPICYFVGVFILLCVGGLIKRIIS